MDNGCVPRRQPWVLGYRIKIAVTIRFLSIKLLQSNFSLLSVYCRLG
jgi:hypothetical protein